MQSVKNDEELRSHPQDTITGAHSQAGLNPAIDWRETGWFLTQEEDELAGYLFTQDYDLRQGSD